MGTVRQISITVLAVMLGLTLAACGATLAGEPEIVATIPPMPTRSAPAQLTADNMPAVPDLARGAALFAENCTECHGITGRGDGPLVQSGDVDAALMVDFTQPSTLSPLERFEVVTNGRLSTLMPPWVNSLSEDDRWHVTHYTLSLAYSDEDIARGADLAADELPAYRDTATLNDSALAEALPDTFSDDDRAAAIAYLRTQGQPVEIAEAGAVVDAPSSGDVPANATAGTITGAVTNASGGGVPDDLTVTLHIINHEGNDTAIDGALDADNTFTFEDVPVDAMSTYVVAAFHEERFFSSTFAPGGPANGSLNLPITLYDVTDDPNVIHISGVIYQITDNGAGSLNVLQIVKIENDSAAMFAGRQTLPGLTRYPSVFLPMLDGATYQPIEGSADRYIDDPERGVIFDTRPVMPNSEHTVHLSYTIPYTDTLDMTQTWPYPIRGFVELYLPEGMTLDSPQLSATSQLVPMGANTFQVYAAEVEQDDGEAVAFTLSGQPIAAAAPDSANTTLGDRWGVNRGLAWVLGIAGGVLMVVSVVMFRQSSVDKASTEDPTLEAIYALETQFKAGEVDEATYNKRMAKLKDKLKHQMQKHAKS